MKQRLRRLCGLLVTTALSGCAAFNDTGSDSPVAQLQASSVQPRPRIAIVLGSGGPLTWFDLSPIVDRGGTHVVSHPAMA